MITLLMCLCSGELYYCKGFDISLVSLGIENIILSIMSIPVHGNCVFVGGRSHMPPQGKCYDVKSRFLLFAKMV